jgi:hypothetical protein
MKVYDLSHIFGFTFRLTVPSLDAMIDVLGAAIKINAQFRLEDLLTETDKNLCSILTDEQKGIAAWSRHHTRLLNSPVCPVGWNKVFWKDLPEDTKRDWIEFAVSSERTFFLDKGVSDVR